MSFSPLAFMAFAILSGFVCLVPGAVFGTGDGPVEGESNRSLRSPKPFENDEMSIGEVKFRRIPNDI